MWEKLLSLKSAFYIGLGVTEVVAEMVWRLARDYSALRTSNLFRGHLQLPKVQYYSKHVWTKGFS